MPPPRHSSVYRPGSPVLHGLASVRPLEGTWGSLRLSHLCSQRTKGRYRLVITATVATPTAMTARTLTADVLPAATDGVENEVDATDLAEDGLLVLHGGLQETKWAWHRESPLEGIATQPLEA